MEPFMSINILLFQNPFNVLQYSIIGDDAAPTYFQIDSTTGVITMRQSISSDPTDIYTVSVAL